MKLTEVYGALGCMTGAACAKGWFGLQSWVEVGTTRLPHDGQQEHTCRLPTLLLSHSHGTLGLCGAKHPALVPWNLKVLLNVVAVLQMCFACKGKGRECCSLNSVRTVVRQLRTLTFGRCAALAVAQTRAAQGLDLGYYQFCKKVILFQYMFCQTCGEVLIQTCSKQHQLPWECFRQGERKLFSSTWLSWKCVWSSRTDQPFLPRFFWG